MRTTLLAAIILSIGICTYVVQADDLKSLATRAVSTDQQDAARAIASLRGAGPESLTTLFDAHREAIEQYRASAGVAGCSPEWQRLSQVLDAVAGQRDAWASRLYWYTDLDQAKGAAAAQNMPILSLRVLGRLNEEYSCANSRFFRTVLYANEEISACLSQHFIMHWESVRPVPRITIDFGDGRKIERTITGNSIHYVLASDGQVIDAMPGMYAPKPFLSSLKSAREANERYAASSDADAKLRLLVQHHQQTVDVLTASWMRDLRAVQATPPSVELASRRAGPPSAREAGFRARSKAFVEAPMLKQLTPPEQNFVAADDSTWQKIAALHADDARLDDSSIRLIASKQDPAAAMRRAISKARVEDPLLKVVRNFERSIAEDTVRNEYLMRRSIHEWLAASPAVTLQSLNERVYADLFLTPSSDPWLGLAPADTYTALPGEGLVVSRK